MQSVVEPLGIPLLPKLKTKHYPIQLPSELGERLMKPVIGQGGWQDLVKVLQAHVETKDAPVGLPVEYAMDLPEVLMHRMIPYAVKFGSGGYQSMIRWILCLVLQQHEASILGPVASLKGKV